MAVGTTVGPSERAIEAALVVAIFTSVVVLLVMGAGFVLDDWWVLSNAHFDGSWRAGGSAQGVARPGSLPIFALVFGGFGEHPLPGFLLLGAVNAATAVLTFRLLLRLLPRWQAGLAALLWVVLPTHTATEMWLTCSLLAISQLAVTGACLLATRSDRRLRHEVAAWALLAASVLSYEASLPVAVVAAVGLAWLSARRVDLRFTLGCLAATGGPGLWILLHWYSGKRVQEVADPLHLLQVNFGWGITPDGPFSPLADPLVLVVLCGIFVACARALLPSWRARTDEWVVLSGVALIVLGFAPFVRYYYEPQGAGDRANYLSAVGGALVWAGLIGMVARLERRAAAAAAVALLALAIPARLERVQVWSAAGRDAQAIADGVVAERPDPSRPVVLGPTPIVVWNVAAVLDHSNVHGALSIAYGTEDIDVRLPLDAAEWEAVPADDRFDIRGPSELDDLSVLRE